MDHPLVEATFESVLAHLSDGVVLLDPHGSILYTNPRAQSILNLYEPIHHIYDLYQHLSLSVSLSYERLENLLTTAGEFTFNYGVWEIEISSKQIEAQGQPFVQFILNGYRGSEGDLSHLSREELLDYIANLENRKGELAEDARQVDHLELLAEAGTVIATSLTDDAILTQFGQYLLDLVDHSLGMAIYRWVGSNACEYVADLSRDVRQDPQYDLGTFSLERFSLLGQLRTDPSILMGEGVSSIPGPPRWATSQIRSTVLLIPLMRGAAPYGAVALGIHMETGSMDVLNEGTFKVINTLFNQASVALERVNLINDLQERQQSLRKLTDELDQRVIERTQNLNEERDRVRWLLRINQELSSTLDEDRVLVRGLELVNEVVMATNGVILLMDESTGGFASRARFGQHQEWVESTYESDEELNRIAGWVVEYRRAMIVDDLKSDLRWVPLAAQNPYQSALGVPLIFSGEVIGVMLLFHADAAAFSESQVRLVEAAAIHVSNAIYNAHLFVLIRNQAERLGHMLRTEQVSAAKTQAILESIADGVLVVDEASEIVLANDAFLSMFDMARERVLGRSLHDLSGLYGQVGDEWRKAIDAWSQASGRIWGKESVEETLNLPDQDKIVRYHLAPVFAGGKFYGSVTTFRDITRDAEVDRMKTEFVSTVSHELRTPLTVIKGYLDLMLMGAMGEVPDSIRSQIGVVKQNTNRLKDLVDDLLDISRIETGRLTLNPEPIDLADLIQRVWHHHLERRIAQEDRSLSVRVDLPADLPMIVADGHRLQQIMTNLVDNAVNYTEDGGRIDISAVRDGETVKIRVQDSGIGITADQLNHIFERFYRAEHELVQKVSGTGLGLPIVKSLVEMHGGRLQVDSRPGEGSTFSFNIPIHTRPAVESTDDG